MIATQHSGFSQYLSLEKICTPATLAHFFYASWEDALWDILTFLQMKPNAVALIPEYFCVDVVENMARHGIRCIEYPVDAQFHTDPNVFAEQITAHKPAIVVVLHADGIPNTLFDHTKEWVKALSHDALLIEDSVHCVVDPQEISLIHPRHVVIDSLRKVTPLWGSNFYGNVQTFGAMLQTSWTHTVLYQLRLSFWWTLVQVSLMCSKLPIPMWNGFWAHLAEWAYSNESDVIGDSDVAAPGWWLFKLASQYIDIAQIRNAKEMQVARYERNLASAWKVLAITPLRTPSNTAHRLRGFPVIFPIARGAFMLKALRRAGLLIHFELDDCTWSQKQKVAFLPLGPHISFEEIDHICDLLRLYAQVR